MANAVGVLGIRIERSEDVLRGITQALDHDGPVLVDAVVNRMELAIPPKVQMEMARGFSLYMLKAVLDGRGGDQCVGQRAQIEELIPIRIVAG